jgi:hypothetical protein
MPCPANVEERLDWQNWIDRDVTNPALLPGLLQMMARKRKSHLPDD